jgi:hypothetical protein
MINTTSFGVTAAVSRMATAVRPVPIIATATSGDMRGGTSCSAAAGASARST